MKWVGGVSGGVSNVEISIVEMSNFELSGFVLIDVGLNNVE